MKWLQVLFGKAKRVQPEAKFVLSFDGSVISLNDPNGKNFRIAVSDLQTVMVETNDTGPWGMDVWWVLLDSQGRPDVIYPQGATGEAQVMDFLMALPGFNQAEMINAMGSAENAAFPVWQKPEH